MVNRDMANRFPPKKNKPGEVMLECKGITGKYMPSCIDVSFELRKGEVLGVAGLVGSRRTELLNTLFGTMTMGSGEMYLGGKRIYNKNSGQSKKNGFALITEERRATGIFPEMNILFNSTIANIRQYMKGGFLSGNNMVKDTAHVIESLKVKTPGQKARIKSLSGGNQQKVIIGRWLLSFQNYKNVIKTAYYILFGFICFWRNCFCSFIFYKATRYFNEKWFIYRNISNKNCFSWSNDWLFYCTNSI
jgi:methyl-galactoside transport system ATP-binding protein